MMAKVLPYAVAFFSSLALTLILTPLVREANRRLGMVDKPDPRRINKVPIPRGGGLAIVLGLYLAYGAFWIAFDRPVMMGTYPGLFTKMSALSVLVALLGLADDRFSLSPRLKLLGQLVIAGAVWAWAGLGFRDIWPDLPAAADCLLTVFWVVGAINAFNLIDGLDGLASGLALIAVMGMAGALFFVQSPGTTFFYFAIMGALVGFLKYNYNPASVFLGDCGSMFLGFLVSTLPLASHTPNSFMISVGVPLLAMGVPIFDTSLAILRRTIRRLLRNRTEGEGVGNDRVMTADADHLHHRILRAVGMNQRRAAWTLYALSASLVAVGFVGLTLQSRAAGLWLVALAGAAVVIFRDMASVELFDAGRLLNLVAHERSTSARRRRARLAVPALVALDLAALIAAFLVTAWALRIGLSPAMLRSSLPLRVAPTFLCLIVFHAYGTVWPRAQLSNYLRLFLACAFGAVIGTTLVYYVPSVPASQYKAFFLIYALLTFVAVAGIRIFRSFVRDVFYAIDCSRLRASKAASRVLVYGAGLRYRSFRRELVRTASSNNRSIVGLIDDDLTLRGQRIGGLRVYGPLVQAPEVIRRLRVDAVVIACDVSPEWLRIIRETLAPTGVRITHFSFKEEVL